MNDDAIVAPDGGERRQFMYEDDKKTRRTFLKYGAALLATPATILSLAPKRGEAAPNYAHPAWAINRTIYEANPYFTTAHATFAELAAELPRFRSLGIGILYIMPIYPRGGVGSMYCVKDYYATDPKLGTIADFRSLVSQAHSYDIRVIQDFVINHTSFEHPWVQQHPDWYKQDANGNILSPKPQWTNLAQLDWSKQAVRTAVREAALFWIKQADIDGYRWDHADMVPPEWFGETREAAQVLKPDIFFLAEGDRATLHPANDMTYSFALQEQVFPSIVAGQSATMIDDYLRSEGGRYPADHIRMRYTATHDTSYQRTSEFSDYGGEAAYQAFAVITCTMKGKAMIYSGQECGMDQPLEGYNRVTANPNYLTSPWRTFYATLFKHYRSNPAVHSGGFVKLTSNNDTRVYAFGRRYGDRRIIVVVNTGSAGRSVSVSIPTEFQASYTHLFSGSQRNVGGTYNVWLPGWGYQILTR